MATSMGPGSAAPAVTSFRQGILWSVPVVLGYFPVGIAYGVLARAHGLTVAEATLMSMMVYAGSAQFIAIQLLAAGSGPWQLIASAALVNSRHLLMSASLCRRLGNLSPLAAGILAFGVTDETFVMASSRIPVTAASAPDGGGDGPGGPADPSGGPRRRALAESVTGLNLASYLAWVTASAAGATLGGAAMALAGDALVFAAPAMFVGLLCLSVRGPLSALVAALSGALSLSLALTIGGRWNVVLAAAVAAGVGTMLRRGGGVRCQDGS